MSLLSFVNLKSFGFLYKQVNLDEETPEKSSKENLLYTGIDDRSFLQEQYIETIILKRTLWRWKFATLVIGPLNLVLFAFVLLQSVSVSDTSTETPTLYSPADVAVDYKKVVFHNNFHEDRTPWQGPPTDEVDQAWLDLYSNIGIVKIDGESASKLPNQTLPVPGEKDAYIDGIEVFHQIHCLNSIRKALYPERYKEIEGMTPIELKTYQVHLEHCVDNIRQVIMCYSDISTIPWIINPRFHRPAPDAHTTHICRDFDKIQEWARENSFTQAEYDSRLAIRKSGELSA